MQRATVSTSFLAHTPMSIGFVRLVSCFLVALALNKFGSWNREDENPASQKQRVRRSQRANRMERRSLAIGERARTPLRAKRANIPHPQPNFKNVPVASLAANKFSSPYSHTVFSNFSCRLATAAFLKFGL